MLNFVGTDVIDRVKALSDGLLGFMMPAWPEFYRDDSDPFPGFHAETSYVKNQGTPQEGLTHHTLEDVTRRDEWIASQRLAIQNYFDLAWLGLNAIAAAQHPWDFIEFGSKDAGFDRNRWKAGSIDFSIFAQWLTFLIGELSIIKDQIDVVMTDNYDLLSDPWVIHGPSGFALNFGIVDYVDVSGVIHHDGEIQPWVVWWDHAVELSTPIFGRPGPFPHIAYSNEGEFWWYASKREVHARRQIYARLVGAVSALASTLDPSDGVRIWGHGSQTDSRGV